MRNFLNGIAGIAFFIMLMGVLGVVFYGSPTPSKLFCNLLIFVFPAGIVSSIWNSAQEVEDTFFMVLAAALNVLGAWWCFGGFLVVRGFIH